MAEGTGVLVVGEAQDGELSLTSKEILAAARNVADALGQELAIGLFGDTLEGQAQQAIVHGADKVYSVTHPSLAGFQAELYLSAMEPFVKKFNPGIILIGRTSEGRELAPRLAFRLGVGLAQDCLEFRWMPAPASCWPIVRCTAATPWPWSAATILPKWPPFAPKFTSL